MTSRDNDIPRQAPASSPDCSEGESNLSPRRSGWNERLGDETREAIARDADAFIHQSVSSPCMSAIRSAEGIWVEDMDGHRFMDFHGNNVHHIGYGHPRLKAAIARQMDDLPFAPRRRGGLGGGGGGGAGGPTYGLN